MTGSKGAPQKLRGCGVYLLSDDGSRILLTQRGPGARHEPYKWEGPGGALEPGETYEQGAKRELLEELGVSVQLDKLVATYDEIIDAHGMSWEAQVFTGRTTDVPSIQEPTKCVGFAWFTKAEVKALYRADALASYSVNDLRHLGWL